MVPGNQPADYTGGSIQRVDLATGRVETRLHRVRRPSAARPERPRLRRAGRLLVHRPRQDAAARSRSHGRLLRAARRLEHPRGDLPARRAERHRPLAGRPPALRRRDAHRPGVLVGARPAPAWCVRIRSRRTAATCWSGLPGMQLLDSMAIDAEGNVCVATLVNGGITIISPDGSRSAARAAAGSAHHEPRLRRARSLDRLHHALGHRDGWWRCRGATRGLRLAFSQR